MSLVGKHEHPQSVGEDVGDFGEQRADRVVISLVHFVIVGVAVVAAYDHMQGLLLPLCCWWGGLLCPIVEARSTTLVGIGVAAVHRLGGREGRKADGGEEDDDDDDNEDLERLLLLCWSRLLQRLRLVGLVAAGIMVEEDYRRMSKGAFGCFEDVSTLSAAEVRHKVSRLEWLYQISFSWQVDGE